MGRILIASSATPRRRDLRVALEAERHIVTDAATAAQAIDESRSGSHDVLIVDSEIVGSDLYSVCRAIRPQSDLGIVALIGTGMEQARIDALNAGADDYLADPFVYAELRARIRAILRRVGRPAEKQCRVILEDRAIDLRTHKIQGPGRQVTPLTPKEFLVLQYLIARGDKPVSNRDLAQTVWQRDGSGDVEYVRVVISQLRRKLERDHNRPNYIVTERAVGYRFKIPCLAVPQSPEYRSPAYKTGSQAMAQ